MQAMEVMIAAARTRLNQKKHANRIYARRDGRKKLYFHLF
jgi:hypothetical protein